MDKEKIVDHDSLLFYFNNELRKTDYAGHMIDDDEDIMFYEPQAEQLDRLQQRINEATKRLDVLDKMTTEDYKNAKVASLEKDVFFYESECQKANSAILRVKTQRSYIETKKTSILEKEDIDEEEKVNMVSILDAISRKLSFKKVELDEKLDHNSKHRASAFLMLEDKDKTFLDEEMADQMKAEIAKLQADIVYWKEQMTKLQTDESEKPSVYSRILAFIKDLPKDL